MAPPSSSASFFEAEFDDKSLSKLWKHPWKAFLKKMLEYFQPLFSQFSPRFLVVRLFFRL